MAQVFSLQTPAGIFDQFAAEQPLGLIMAHIEVTGMPTGAVGLAQFGPAAGSVEGAREVCRIHERLHQQDGMAVAGLPVITQAGQHAAEGFGGEVGNGLVGQEQEPGVADDQRKPAAALFIGPADPLIARAQPAGGGAENQHAEPVALGIRDRVAEPLADRFETAQVMVFSQELLNLRQLVRGQEADLNAVQEVLLVGGEQSQALRHDPRVNRRRALVQSSVLTHVPSSCCQPPRISPCCRG